MWLGGNSEQHLCGTVAATDARGYHFLGRVGDGMYCHILEERLKMEEELSGCSLWSISTRITIGSRFCRQISIMLVVSG